MLSREWLQAFVPVGVVVGQTQWLPTGAGVLFFEHDLVWLVTAQHVVRDANKERASVLLNKSDESVVVVQLADIQHSAGFSWIEDATRDIAATPIPIASELLVKAVSRRDCIPLTEVVPSMPAYTVGCPYGMGIDPNKPAPLVLDGVVCGTRAHDAVIFTSALMFPGNAGGPLIVYRTPFTPAGGLVVGNPMVLLAGIVLATTLVPAPAQHAGTPPLHLGIARSSDAVWDLLGSQPAIDLATQLRSSTRT